jgi:hypothetical protein
MIFFIISINLLSAAVLGQKVTVVVNFECDGVIKKVKRLELSIFDQQDTVVIRTNGNRVEIPSSMCNRQVTLRFSINKKALFFRNVPVAWNDDHLEWNIVVDNKPFNRERFWSIENWEKVEKMVYYLDYGNGKQVTDYE